MSAIPYRRISWRVFHLTLYTTKITRNLIILAGTAFCLFPFCQVTLTHFISLNKSQFINSKSTELRDHITDKERKCFSFLINTRFQMYGMEPEPSVAEIVSFY